MHMIDILMYLLKHVVFTIYQDCSLSVTSQYPSPALSVGKSDGWISFKFTIGYRRVIDQYFNVRLGISGRDMELT